MITVVSASTPFLSDASAAARTNLVTRSVSSDASISTDTPELAMVSTGGASATSSDAHVSSSDFELQTQHSLIPGISESVPRPSSTSSASAWQTWRSLIAAVSTVHSVASSVALASTGTRGLATTSSASAAAVSATASNHEQLQTSLKHMASANAPSSSNAAAYTTPLISLTTVARVSSPDGGPPVRKRRAA